MVHKMGEDNDASIKRMADLLRRGATMLAESCPQCGSPLMKVGNDIYCATCNRRIVYAKSDSTPAPIATTLPELRETLLEKLRTVNETLQRETDVEVLTKLSNLVVLLLRALRELNKV